MKRSALSLIGMAYVAHVFCSNALAQELGVGTSTETDIIPAVREAEENVKKIYDCMTKAEKAIGPVTPISSGGYQRGIWIEYYSSTLIACLIDAKVDLGEYSASGACTGLVHEYCVMPPPNPKIPFRSVAMIEFEEECRAVAEQVCSQYK